jgi:hypothetical protein
MAPAFRSWPSSASSTAEPSAVLNPTASEAFRVSSSRVKTTPRSCVSFDKARIRSGAFLNWDCRPCRALEVLSVISRRLTAEATAPNISAMAPRLTGVADVCSTVSVCHKGGTRGRGGISYCQQPPHSARPPPQPRSVAQAEMAVYVAASETNGRAD